VRRLARLVPVVLGLAACKPGPPPAIGFNYRNPSPNLADVALAALTDAAPGLRLTVTPWPDSAPAPGQAPEAFLPAEVDHATRLAASRRVIAAVGPGGSREGLMTAPVYDQARIPRILPTATSRRLVDAGPWTFVLPPNDSIEGAFIGRFVGDALGARSAVIFYVPDEYGTGLRDGALAALDQHGVRVTDQVPLTSSGHCPPTGPNPYVDVVDAALERGRPEVVILASRQREGGCVAGRVRTRLPGARFVAGDGLLLNDDFVQRAGGAADSTYAVAFWHADLPDSASRAFVERFTRIVGRAPDHGDALAYDAVMVLAEAVRAVGPDRGRIRAYLASLGRERPAYHGVTGPITFPSPAGRLYMTRLLGGRPVLAAP
jgi:branched-chain amino acid transport system substrate-binding protein